MDYLDLKDSSRANQLDCVISYFFQLYLMLAPCMCPNILFWLGQPTRVSLPVSRVVLLRASYSVVASDQFAGGSDEKCV